MSTRSYDARHRSASKPTARPRRLLAGLALPTAAAAAVTFGATGAGMANSTKTVSGSQTAPRSTQQAAATDAATAQERTQALQALQVKAKAVAQTQALAVARLRASAVAKAARDAQRKTVAARTLEAQRVARARAWQMPIRSVPKTSGFGWRWGRLHAGEDFAAPEGTNLVAMSTGKVVFAGSQSGFGNLIKIRYWDGTVSFFAHMSHLSAHLGESVAPGQVVGQSGNTGHSTGPHLHLEIHPAGGGPVDPLPWLANHRL